MYWISGPTSRKIIGTAINPAIAVAAQISGHSRQL
jgi:hypothetical protein